jgi:hypothetical protein
VTTVQPAWEAIPGLAYEYGLDPAKTTLKFYQFIDYHESMKQSCTADLYRCALVQLRAGLGAETLGLMHPRVNESCPEAKKRLRLEVGL